MGVLPLQFRAGETAASLGLLGSETFSLAIDDHSLLPRQDLEVIAAGEERDIRFTVTLRADTPVEIDYLRNGGILHTVLRRMAQS